MKIKLKKTDQVGSSSNFNTHSVSEILVSFNDWYDTDYIKNYDVWLEQSHQWKDLGEAFKSHDVITDNYNTVFFEPTNEQDRARGFAL